MRFANGLQTIGEEAFAGCKALTSIKLPASVTDCENKVFEGCSKLQSVQLSDKMTRLSYRLFKDCSSLQSIELPASINFISSEVFAHCNSLTAIHHPSGKYEMAENALDHCSASILVPYKSSDLKMELARGNVKSIVYISSVDYANNDTINYTPDGYRLYDKIWGSKLDPDDFEIERNNKGQLISFVLWPDAESYIEEYTYNEDGFIASYGSYSDGAGGGSECEYNEKNELIKEMDEGVREPSGNEEYIHTITYSNYKYDHCGNWISRDVKEEWKFKIFDEERGYHIHNPENDTSETSTQKRVIIYYD